MKRPISVSAVSIIAVVMSFITAYGVFANRDDIRELMAASPLQAAVIVGWCVDCTLVTLLAGIAVYRGKNWGRWLLAAAIVFSFIVRLASVPRMAMIPIDLVMVYFLFTPPANAFFRGSDSAE